MLKHPWLDMPDNYEFKYTNREYDVMILKKDFNNQVRGKNAQQDDAVLEDRQEMNELIESDPELYAGDIDTKPSTKPDAYHHILQSKADDENMFDEDEISLEDPEEARENLKVRQDQECKIHNSFTGPYPLDPTEFSHTDKGENAQFTTLIRPSKF
jgi:hypothetical protein